MSFVADLTALVGASADDRHHCPPSWRRVALGEVATIINGYPFKSGGFGSKGEPVIRIRDVARGFTETRFDGPLPDGYWVERGELVVGMDGDFNTALWRSDRALLNQRVCKIAPDETRLDRRYLAYALPGYLQLINAHTPSVTVKHLSSRTLASIPLPLPDIAVQRRIADRIDELFAEIDDGEAALARARDDLATWRKALLKAAVTGELTAEWRAERLKQDGLPTETGADLLARILAERQAHWSKSTNGKAKRYRKPKEPETAGLPKLPDGWCWATLDQLTKVITSGSRAWSRYYNKGSAVFIMAQNVRRGRYDQSFVQTIDPPKEDPERRRTKVRRDDLLLTIVGANTGDLCRLDFDPVDYYVCQSVALLRLVEPALANFVEAFFAGSYGRGLQMEKWIYGAGRPHLSFDQIQSLCVPLPPLLELPQITANLKPIIDQFEGLVAAVANDGATSSTLRQSILAAAFRGDLA